MPFRARDIHNEGKRLKRSKKRKVSPKTAEMAKGLGIDLPISSSNGTPKRVVPSTGSGWTTSGSSFRVEDAVRRSLGPKK